ncbi:MAG: hypothetical protein CBE33_03410 [Candidatus Pelagibacter sp. TMED273]|nr:MAG: hypothetical protein CBE33_03410 [Candidatus Pelagibacter sp. TMED273]|tara:strand:- start:350 stop:772 length:423 start_codon:yes stop_codon:yes gene_type:complete
MKTTITKSLIQFITVTTFLTVIFRISLSEFLNEQLWSFVFIPPLIYFILMYVSGRYFGIKEYKYLPIGDIGFRFHVSTFIVFLIVSYLMYYLGYMSNSEPRGILDITISIWGIFLIIHMILFFKSKNDNIMGINKEDIFD